MTAKKKEKCQLVFEFSTLVCWPLLCSLKSCCQLQRSAPSLQCPTQTPPRTDKKKIKWSGGTNVTPPLVTNPAETFRLQTNSLDSLLSTTISRHIENHSADPSHTISPITLFYNVLFAFATTGFNPSVSQLFHHSCSAIMSHLHLQTNFPPNSICLSFSISSLKVFPWRISNYCYIRQVDFMRHYSLLWMCWCYLGNKGPQK